MQLFEGSRDLLDRPVIDPFEVRNSQETSFLFVTDPGRDLDDEETIALGIGLQRVGLPMNMLGLTTCLAPSSKRALLTELDSSSS